MTGVVPTGDAGHFKIFSAMKLTYYGHSCFSVFTGGKTLLFDPFITPNELARAVDVDKIPADYIFISHGHFDHVTDVARIARRTGAMVLGNWELYNWFNELGLKNTHPINPGGQFTFDFGTVKSFTAVHSSSLPDGRYAGVASGFAFQTVSGSFYYSGDTGLTLDMKLVADWTKPDFAVFPVGGGLTMGADDAIEAARLVGAKQIVGVHYDTFGFIKIDHAKAVETFKHAGLTLHLPDIGSAIEL
jgi:L-ascorbate metabolism protein UlaG (beta-lactamase superfamily)